MLSLEQNKICKIFLKQGRTEQCLGFTLGSLEKTDLKSTISLKALPIFPKELIKLSMQYITARKCITTHIKLGKSGVL